MLKLLKYLKGYRKESLFGPLFKLLEATLELFIPLLVASIIDRGIQRQDSFYIIKTGLLMAALGLIGLLFSVTAQYFAAKASVGFTTAVRQALFYQIQRFSFTQLDQTGSATLITRMTSDMNQVQNTVNLALRLLLRSPFVVLGALVMAFTIDRWAAFVFMITIPILALVVFGIMLLCLPLYQKVQGALDRLLSKTRENLTGARVLRAFCKEEEETKEFDRRNRFLANTQKRVGRISALLNPVTYLLINLAIIALLQVGAVRVHAGILSQGAVVALYNYMTQILVELIKLADLMITLTKGIACGNRIQAVLELKSGDTDTEALPVPEKNSPYALEFRHVSFCYPGAQENALTDISIRLRFGETLGIIGGTGAGKSTLVSLIPRFYEATLGTVLVDGADVRSLPLRDLRQKIGFVLQKAVLFRGTIRENLRWGNPDAADPALWEALKIAQADGVVREREHQLDALVEQGGRNYSGGQRQRLTIARALVRIPKILILDDSASALDFATDAALRRALREMPNQPATIIISQRTSAIRHADQILVLDDGQAVGLGTHDALLANCSVYREIYDSQYQKGGRAR